MRRRPRTPIAHESRRIVWAETEGRHAQPSRLSEGRCGHGAAGSAGASLTGIAASAAQAEPAASETLGFTYHNEHCLCNCMLQCTVRDGRLAMIQPRENEDKRFQNVCLKGISKCRTFTATPASSVP